MPTNVFISTFDTAPLGANLNLAVEGRGAEFQKGLDVLSRLTEGAVHLGLDARDGKRPAAAFMDATGVEKHFFRGPHPAGNVGIQIHHVAPIGKSDKVWILGVQDVITLGSLFLHGKYDAGRVVAIAGSPVEAPCHVRTFIGANMDELLKGKVNANNLRLISGNVLSGKSKAPKGYVNFYDNEVTVIEEGDHYDMFGWLFPSKPRPSVSRTYISGLVPGLKYQANTNTNGEKRAFVVTGQYERMLPMDIYPQHLMKAILTKDIERMEGLGINELSEEDVALCEVCLYIQDAVTTDITRGP